MRTCKTYKRNSPAYGYRHSPKSRESPRKSGLHGTKIFTLRQPYSPAKSGIFAAVYGLKLSERKQRIEDIIKVFGFSDIENQKSEDLPLGFKQRLSMACALIHNPPILFLDEPTSGVDVVTRKDF